MPRAGAESMVRLTTMASAQVAGRAEGYVAEGLLEAMFLLAVADGDLDDEEVRQLARACEALLGDAVEANLEPLFLQWSSAIAEEGWEPRMRTIAASVAGTELADPAFRLAVVVALADGRMLPDEADGIDLMAQALGIRPDAAAQIVQDVVRNLPGLRS